MLSSTHKEGIRLLSRPVPGNAPVKMDEQALLDALKAEFAPPLSPTLITTLLFDFDESDPLSLGAIRDTCAVLAQSAQHDLDQEDQHHFEQQLLEQDRDATDEDENEEVNQALRDWSLSSETTRTTGTSESTDSTSVDGISIGEDTTGARKFLQTLFPHLSASTLQTALNEDPDADLEDVVEYLLSVESIRETEERGGAWEGDGAKAADDWEGLSQAERDARWEAQEFEDEEAEVLSRSASLGGVGREVHQLDAPFQEVTNRSRPKTKKPPKATTTITLGSLPLHQGHTRSKSASSNTSTRSASKRQPHASTSHSPLISTPASASYQPSLANSPNPWAAHDSLAHTLSAHLPAAPPALFSSHLHHPSYPSTYAAILAAITVVAEQSPDGDDGPRSDMMLEIIFGDEDDAEQETHYKPVVDTIWKAARGDLSRALDVWALLIDVEGWAPYAPADVTPVNPAKSIWVRKDISKDVLVSSIPGPSSLRSTTTSANNSPNPSPQVVTRPLPSASDGPADSFPALAHQSLVSGPFSIAPPSPVQSSSRPVSPPPPQTIITNGAPKPSFPRRPLPQKVHNMHNRWNPTGKDAKFVKPPLPEHRLAESIPAYARAGKTKEGKAERWQELREKEMLERVLRNEALMMATRYFKSGSAANQGGSVAAHYAENARKLGERTRLFGLDAAKAQLRQTNQYTSTYLDLHGLTSYQSLSIVREAVHTWWDTRTSTPPSPPYVIITGVGRHSTNGKAVLAPAVSKMLKDDGWKISKGVTGQISVLGAA